MPIGIPAETAPMLVNACAHEALCRISHCFAVGGRIHRA
jgi:hypothetical protein